MGQFEMAADNYPRSPGWKSRSGRGIVQPHALPDQESARAWQWLWAVSVANGVAWHALKNFRRNVVQKLLGWRLTRAGRKSLMTINVALVTNEVLVLGCDSVASTKSYVLDPFRLRADQDDKGTLIRDDKGRFILRFKFDDLDQVVTDAWGGVTKMFTIHPDPSPVVAITAGLAKLNDRPISNIGNEFLKSQETKTRKFVNMELIVKSFEKVIQKEYIKHYRGSKRPKEFWDGPEFLVGGYGRDDIFPSPYRVKIKERTCVPSFKDGKCGLAWNGEADAVERLVFGVDGMVYRRVRDSVQETFDSHHDNMKNAVLRILGDVLDKLKADLPDDVNTDLPDKPKINPPWGDLELDVDFANLALQDAVDLVSYLVMMQAGKSRFTRGVATVGGRTHIGVIRKDRGFEMLNEPLIEHIYTGFAHD